VRLNSARFSFAYTFFHNQSVLFRCIPRSLAKAPAADSARMPRSPRKKLSMNGCSTAIASLRLRHTNTQIQEFVKQLTALPQLPV
jgi:hypothetical protein